MEISDAERREVAAALRVKSKETKGMRERAKDDFLIPTMVDGNLYSTMRMRAIRSCIGQGDIFERLADLIDRPKCHMDRTDTHKTAEGLEIRSWECDRCGRTCEEVYGHYEFCPHCGAKVIPFEE